MPDGSLHAAPEPGTGNAAAQPKSKDPREVSTIAFPYHTLVDAIEVARAILNKGAVPMARDQVAAAMGQQAGSGNFTNKIVATRMFGLIETVAGKYQLTPLGFDILDKDEPRCGERPTPPIDGPLDEPHKICHIPGIRGAAQASVTKAKR